MSRRPSRARRVVAIPRTEWKPIYLVELLEDRILLSVTFYGDGTLYSSSDASAYLYAGPNAFSNQGNGSPGVPVTESGSVPGGGSASASAYESAVASQSSLQFVGTVQGSWSFVSGVDPPITVEGGASAGMEVTTSYITPVPAAILVSTSSTIELSGNFSSTGDGFSATGFTLSSYSDLESPIIDIQTQNNSDNLPSNVTINETVALLPGSYYCDFFVETFGGYTYNLPGIPNGGTPSGSESASGDLTLATVPSTLNGLLAMVPAACNFGDTLSPELQISNGGGLEAIGTEQTSYYLSTTPDLTGTTYLLNSNSYSFDILAGGSETESPSLSVPYGITSGTYYLVAQVSAADNAIVASGPIQVGPILSGKFTGPIPSIAYAGATISPALQITDSANAAAVVNGYELTAYYLSTTPDLSGITALLASNSYSLNLDPGGSSTESQQVTIPQNTALGTYYLVAQIDAGGAIENQPGSIVASGPIQIEAPDLTGSFVPSSIPASAQSGGALSPQLTITDSGNVPATGFEQNEYYLSTTPDLSGSVADLGSDFETLNLNPGGSITESPSLAIPENISAGTYYLVAQINSYQLIQESNYNNDLAVSGPIQIVAGAPSLLTLANLSEDVYNVGEFSGYMDYVPLFDADAKNINHDTGFQAVAYQDTDNPSQVVVAFRGTVVDTSVTSLKNFAADLGFGSSTPTSILTNYVTDALLFVDDVALAFPNANITLTGHSLGGALAQLVGDATGLTAEVFNAPGAAQVFPSLFPGVSPKATTSTSIDYRIYGDQVSLFGSPIDIGSVVTLNDPTGQGNFVLTGNPIYDFIANISNIVGVHSITNFITDFANNALPLKSPNGQPNVSYALEAEQYWASSQSVTSLGGSVVLNFLRTVTGSIANIFDPSDGPNFVFLGQPGSPYFQSIVLPSFSGVATYQVRYQANGSWSAFQDLPPGTEDDLPTNVTGIQFVPLDASGQSVSINDSLLFGVTFDSTGTLNGAVTESPGDSNGVEMSTGGTYSISEIQGTPVVDVTSGTAVLTAAFAAIYPNAILEIETGARVVLDSDQVFSGLSLNGGSLDIGTYSVEIDYGAGLDPISSIMAWITDGYAQGTWTGMGITSSDSESDPESYGIGYADSSDPGNPANLAPNQIKVMYTLLGDVNLDGKVNGTDFTIMAEHFNQAVTNGWDEGDFNYDGKVNGTDFNLMAANFNQAANLNPAGLPGLILGGGAEYSVSGSSGSQTLDILSGTVTLTSDLSALLPNYSLKIEAGASVVLASDQNIGGLQLVLSGTLNIGNYTIFINNGNGPDPIAFIAAWIKSGYNDGSWNGSGIMSSAAQVSPSYGIGYADSADAGNPASLASGQIKIMYTLLGDANLDGKVNGTDFEIMAAHFNQAVTNGWDEGDFNYDGAVNGTDFTLQAENFNQSASQSAVVVSQASSVSTQGSSTNAMSDSNDVVATVLDKPVAKKTRHSARS